MSAATKFTRRRWWFPIQFGYNPHPWWKFEHLQRYHPILMPICRRRYPMHADVLPPRDIEMLVRWMQRWSLLPPGLPAREVRCRLEALATTPVEIVKADGLPVGDPSIGVRLPAEWEPTEAVLVAWPVLYPGLWDFYCELAAAIAPVARVDVVIPHAVYAPAVLAHLQHRRVTGGQVRFLVAATDDIWIRDYGPLTGLDSAGRRVMVDAIFDPPPAMPFANDDAFPVRYAAHQGFPCRHLSLHLEGGNFWSDGRGTLITTDAVFARNPLRSRDEVQRQLLESFAAETLIVLPPLRMEDTGHVDVFLKLATPETVLITEPRSIVNRERLTAVVDVFRNRCNAAGDPYRVVTLPSLPHYRNWGLVRVWPSYTNALTVNGRVVVPTYRDARRDAAALAVYRKVLPDHEVVGIDASVAANAGGTVHCLTMQIPADQPPPDPRVIDETFETTTGNASGPALMAPVGMAPSPQVSPDRAVGAHREAGSETRAAARSA